MAANPLEALFKMRKENNDKREKEVEARKKLIKDSLEIMNPLCESMFLNITKAVDYANKELLHSKLHVLSKDRTTELDSLYLRKGIILVVATNKDIKPPTIRNFSNYTTLIFDSDLDSKTTKITFFRGGRENKIREHSDINIDLKNMVYTEIAGFLANNYIN
ncbi:MAG: hypothetical protein VB106_14250 [Clostridiaceae bacterium]|nr:hypothetical protein [Clostridiaceae bacterium]